MCPTDGTNSPKERDGDVREEWWRGRVQEGKMEVYGSGW